MLTSIALITRIYTILNLVIIKPIANTERELALIAI